MIIKAMLYDISTIDFHATWNQFPCFKQLSMYAEVENLIHMLWYS